MVQSKTRTRVASRAVFKTLAVATVVAGVVVAPNAGVLLDKYFRYNDKQKKKARQILNELKYRQLITVKNVDGQMHYRLTGKGLARYHKLVLDDLEVKTPKSWDGSWRAVMFDIPATQGSARKRLVKYLHDLQFYKLQDSVWIHPFECEEVVGVLINLLHLEKHVSYVVISRGNFFDHAVEHYKQRGLLL